MLECSMCSLIGEPRGFPCPQNWQYVPGDGACYCMLSRWKEYTWQQAETECKNLNNDSSLWYLDEDGVVDFGQSDFSDFQNGYFWIYANYSSGMHLYLRTVDVFFFM